MNDIHPVFEKMIGQHEKETFLNQKAKVIWFTGLSGSGKSTIALSLEKRLHEKDFFTQVLDGDNVRTGINNNLGFSEEDRTENIRRIAEISKLFVNCGIITLNSFVSPTNAIRKLAKEIIGKDNFIEIFVDTPIEICEQRDVKGLYKKAREGKIKDFTGITSPFEAPKNPDLTIKTENRTIENCVEEVFNFIVLKIKSKV
jgi:adenylylsulfate kinase